MTGDLDSLRDTDHDKRRQIAADMISDYRDLIRRFGEAPAAARARCVNLGLDKFSALAARDNYELAAKILGDHDLVLSHMMAVWAMSQHAPVYSCVFSNESVPGKSVAGHGHDKAFVFGTQAVSAAWWAEKCMGP